MTDHPLRRWRKEKHMTLEALAAKAGVQASHLSEIENGRNTPSLRLAAKLSRVTADKHGKNPAVALEDFVPSEAAE